jgi:hypothetical protein
MAWPARWKSFGLINSTVCACRSEVMRATGRSQRSSSRSKIGQRIRLRCGVSPDALTAFALVHAHGAARARVEDRLNDTDDCAAAPAVRLNWFRSRLSLCCVHEHLEYRSSRLSVSPWDHGIIVTLGADEREAGGGGCSPPAFRSFCIPYKDAGIQLTSR